MDTYIVKPIFNRYLPILKILTNIEPILTDTHMIIPYLPDPLLLLY